MAKKDFPGAGQPAPTYETAMEAKERRTAVREYAMAKQSKLICTTTFFCGGTQYKKGSAYSVTPEVEAVMKGSPDAFRIPEEDEAKIAVEQPIQTRFDDDDQK